MPFFKGFHTVLVIGKNMVILLTVCQDLRELSRFLLCMLSEWASTSLFQVFEKGVQAIPLSVDLWMHYIKFTMNTGQDKEDFIATLRRCRLSSYSHYESDFTLLYCEGWWWCKSLARWTSLKFMLLIISDMFFIVSSIIRLLVSMWKVHHHLLNYTTCTVIWFK